MSEERRAGVIVVSEEFLAKLLGMEDALFVSVTPTPDFRGYRFLIVHPSMPPFPRGSSATEVTIEETVKTCEHGGILERSWRVVGGEE